MDDIIEWLSIVNLPGALIVVVGLLVAAYIVRITR
jgi:hypothetical protein